MSLLQSIGDEDSVLEDVTIEDLLKFDDSDGDLNQNGDHDDDGDEGEDDPDFLELQRKLTGSPSLDNNKDSGPITMVNGDGVSPFSPEAVVVVGVEPLGALSAEALVIQLKKENAELQQRLEELHLANDRGDPNAPNMDDLLQQISDLETQVVSLQQQRERSQKLVHPTSAGVSSLLQRIQALETMNRRLEDGNSQLQEQVHELQQENEKLQNNPCTSGSDERAVPASSPNDHSKTQNNDDEVEEEVVEEETVVPVSSKLKPDLPQTSAWQHAGQIVRITELEGLVQNLQERIMSLVEEKLELKLKVDRLEHDLKQHQHLGGSTATSLFPPKRGGWFSNPHSTTTTNKEHDISGDEDDTNIDGNEPHTQPSQTDYLKQAMIKKKQRESGSLFGGFLGGTSSSSKGDNIGSNHKKDLKEEDGLESIDHALYKKFEDHKTRYGAESLGLKNSSSSNNDDFEQVVNDFESSFLKTIHETATTATATTAKKGGFANIFASSKSKATVMEEDGQFMVSPNRDTDRTTTMPFPPPMAMDLLPSMLGIGKRKESGEAVLLPEGDEEIDFDSK